MANVDHKAVNDGPYESRALNLIYNMRLLGMLPTPPGESLEPVEAWRRPANGKSNSGAPRATKDGPPQEMLDSMYRLGQMAAEDMAEQSRELKRGQQSSAAGSAPAGLRSRR